MEETYIWFVSGGYGMKDVPEERGKIFAEQPESLDQRLRHKTTLRTLLRVRDAK